MQSLHYDFASLALMPILERFGATSVRMYADDHRPPHFHIVAPEFQVIVRISDLRVIEGEARANQIADAMVWAKAHRETLALKWAELNERDEPCQERDCRASPPYRPENGL